MRTAKLVLAAALILGAAAFAVEQRQDLYARKLADNLQHLIGTPASETNRAKAYRAMMKWPAKCGVPQRDIYEIIELETAGNFHLRAFNEETKARGLMQLTDAALRQIEAGETLLRNRRLTFDPDWNIRAGCEYYAWCLERAKDRQIKRLNLSRREVAKMYYMAGLYRTESLIFVVLKYGMDGK